MDPNRAQGSQPPTGGPPLESHAQRGAAPFGGMDRILPSGAAAAGAAPFGSNLHHAGATGSILRGGQGAAQGGQATGAHAPVSGLRSFYGGVDPRSFDGNASNSRVQQTQGSQPPVPSSNTTTGEQGTIFRQMGANPNGVATQRTESWGNDRRAQSFEGNRKNSHLGSSPPAHHLANPQQVPPPLSGMGQSVGFSALSGRSLPATKSATAGQPPSSGTGQKSATGALGGVQGGMNRSIGNGGRPEGSLQENIVAKGASGAAAMSTKQKSTKSGIQEAQSTKKSSFARSLPTAASRNATVSRIAPLPPPVNNSPPAQDGMGMRELRVEDALLYLDDVKREFRNRPAVYNEFLTIMKNFKTQEVDTPGVIARVSRLFRGYNHLILGFNTFLPEGYKISLADLERMEAERDRVANVAVQRGGSLSEDEPMVAAAPVVQQMSLKPANQSPPSSSLSLPRGSKPNAAPPLAPAQQPAPVPRRVPAAAAPAPSPVAPRQEYAAKSPPLQQRAAAPAPAQAVEFDHAISYVTTIKRRFANDPSTYHSFLEILHTYQKEQRGIKEVLEQVATLFQDHPDLLREFTFFLPDAVQDQAKERLNRAAEDSEDRLAKQFQQQQAQQQKAQQQKAQQQQAQEQQQQQQAQQQQAQQQAQQQNVQRAGTQKFIDMTGSQVPAVESSSAARKRPLEPTVGTAQQPESFVYNSAVERQFFDAAREALTAYTRDGGQAWAEFMKCLDMYAQEILSRSEMLNFVEPLLGKRHAKLFEEFKRILSAAGATSGAAPPLEDAWYSVPLSEIDFSRCRRCSPSYRALPRDYPPPPCSDRSDEETKVLNDIWVSLPVGSEESYTFRHMRRNTYEEVLFRCEDERFEIDMVIDSNAATLQRLIPIAEEIAKLSQEETLGLDAGARPATEGAGMGGKRFQYTFDKNILGVIHRNTIARIYGDSGNEMLDLMVKNPTIAIPLVVERLRQKDKEWRKARDRLNLHWKDLAEQNYHKSLDHRSLTWRTIDKRATSFRILLAEIKDRAQNGGRESKDAIRQKIEKAKEEHGTFFEVTNVDSLVQDLDLSFLPKPDRLLFTPHLALMYEGVSVANRDAYRILAFALERGSISAHDKERCHRLWNEFLGPWFGLSVTWMQSPAVAYQESTPGTKLTSTPPAVVSEEDEEESMDEEVNVGTRVVTEELPQEPSNNSQPRDYHPLPVGSPVSTLYGSGTIMEFRKTDEMYQVKLGFGGIGYLRPATVLCSVLPVEKSDFTEQLRAEDRSRLMRPGDQMAFGPQNLFLFLRLHQILVHRLNVAFNLAHSVGTDPSLNTLVEQMPNSNLKTVGRSRYEAFLALLYSFLDVGVGGSDGGKYEDRIRSLLGHGSYELATIDKLVANIWKTLQLLAQDETMWSLVQLYRRHKDAGTFQPESFRQEAAYLSDHEPMYAFQSCPIPGNDQSVLYIEYLGIISEEDNDEEMGEGDADDSRHNGGEVEPLAKRPKR